MDAEDEGQTEWDTGPVSRPYTLTGGRTRPRGDRFYALLDVVGLGGATPDRASLGPERIQILDMCRVPVTVADLASAVDLPLGVVRILLDDLAQENLIEVRASAPTTRITDKQLLRQVLDALHALLFSSVDDARTGRGGRLARRPPDIGVAVTYRAAPPGSGSS